MVFVGRSGDGEDRPDPFSVGGEDAIVRNRLRDSLPR